MVLSSLNLLAISFPQVLLPTILVFPSMLLLLFCLTYLIAYPFHVITNLQPTETLKNLHKSVSKNLFRVVVEQPFWSGRNDDSTKEPFIILEQMTIQSIRNNDYDSYRQCLGYLTKTSIMLIKEAEKEYSIQKNLVLLAERTDDIVAFFYRPFDQIKTEVFQAKNGLFILSLFYTLETIITELHTAKAIRALEHVYDMHEGIYRNTVRDENESLVEEFCRSINRIVKIETKTFDTYAFPFEPEAIAWNELTEEQKNERTFNNIMFSYFERRLDFLKEAVELASNHGYKSTVSLLTGTFSDIIDIIIEIKKPHRRWFLTQRIFWSLNEAYKYASEHGIQSTTFIIGMLHYKISQMQKNGIPQPEQVFLVKTVCDLALLNIKQDDYGALFDLGVNGRILVKEQQTLALIIVESLGQALKMVTDKIEPKKVTEQMVKNELESIRNWNNHEHKQIIEKVDEILKQK